MTLGIVFALLSSASFGFNIVGIRRGVSTGAASQGMYITIFSGTVLFVLLALAAGQLQQAATVTGAAYGYMVAGGLLHLMIGRYFNYRTMAAMGANRASPLTGMATLISVLIAMVFLSEVITPLMGVGIVLVMVGPALVARRSRRPAAVAAPSGASPDAPARTKAFEPKLLEGYLFGILTALFWGAGPVLMRAGVADNGLGILGGLVGYGAASVVLAASLLLPGQMSGALTLDKGARWWFLFGGATSFLANVFRYSALGLAPVSLVIPLIRLSSVFALAFNFVINRHLESFEPRVLIGILLSIAGATLLVI